MRKIWIMAGEASGDIYGAALAEDLRKAGSVAGEEVEIGGMGGPAMAKANVKRTIDSTELGVVGFVAGWVVACVAGWVGVLLGWVTSAVGVEDGVVCAAEEPGIVLVPTEDVGVDDIPEVGLLTIGCDEDSLPHRDNRSAIPTISTNRITSRMGKIRLRFFIILHPFGHSAACPPRWKPGT